MGWKQYWKSPSGRARRAEHYSNKKRSGKNAYLYNGSGSKDFNEHEALYRRSNSY